MIGFWMRPPVLYPDGTIGVRINGAAGRTVHVQTSSNLTNWTNLQTMILGEKGAELTDDASSATPRFFRVTGAEGE